MPNRKKKGSIGGGILLLAMAFFILAAVIILYNNPQVLGYLEGLIPQTNGYTTTIAQNQNSTTTVASGTSYDYYVLSLINKDRNQFGLGNVTLSGETSGQQHTQSMLDNHYFSHWDIYGMKPYMRYTLVGGLGAVSENIAFNSSRECVGSLCKGTVNVQEALKAMEYSMMYNDSACCNNGHRDNILDPNHNQVSIGISYTTGIVYLAEDFVDNYISWNNGGPGFATNDQVSLSGSIQQPYVLSSVLITYEPPVASMSPSELNQTSSYGYGQQVAGVVGDPLYYYSGIKTILASRYSTSGNQFNIDFSMHDLINQYGAGEYTLMMTLNGTSGGEFVGSTYTLFIDSSDQPYVPSAV